MNKPLGVAGKAIIRKDNNILLLQRSQKSEFDPGLWELPGGKIEYGEELIDSLKREVKEEVGLLIKVGSPFKTWHFYKDQFWVTGVTFLCEYLKGNVNLSLEHQAYNWIEPQEGTTYPLSTATREQIEAYQDVL